MLLRFTMRHVGLLLLLAGCSRALPGPAPAGRLLTEADAGTALALTAGEGFAVQLSSTGGTGYAWEVAAGDPAVVAEEGARRSTPAGPPEQVGGPVLETISFVARGPGATRLELAYRRPWEQGVAPARTFAVDVTVR